MLITPQINQIVNGNFNITKNKSLTNLTRFKKLSTNKISNLNDPNITDQKPSNDISTDYRVGKDKESLKSKEKEKEKEKEKDKEETSEKLRQEDAQYLEYTQLVDEKAAIALSLGDDEFIEANKDNYEPTYFYRAFDYQLNNMEPELVEDLSNYIREIITYKSHNSYDYAVQYHPYLYAMEYPTLRAKAGVFSSSTYLLKTILIVDLSKYSIKDLSELKLLLIKKSENRRLFSPLNEVVIGLMFVIIMYMLLMNNITAVLGGYNNCKWKFNVMLLATMGFYQIINSYYTMDQIEKFLNVFLFLDSRDTYTRMNINIFIFVFFMISISMSSIMIGSTIMVQIRKSMGSFFLMTGIMYMRNLMDSFEYQNEPGLRALKKLAESSRIGHEDMIYHGLDWESDKNTFIDNLRIMHVIIEVVIDFLGLNAYKMKLMQANGDAYYQYYGDFDPQCRMLSLTQLKNSTKEEKLKIINHWKLKNSVVENSDTIDKAKFMKELEVMETELNVDLNQFETLYSSKLLKIDQMYNKI